MKVMKFGGTSVGAPDRMQNVADLITRDNEKKFVVLSAVSGTTNTLVKISNLLLDKNKIEAAAVIEELHGQYLDFIEKLFTTPEGKQSGKSVIDSHFGIIKGMVEIGFTDLEERLLLSQGEMISTQLFHHFLKEKGIKSQIMMALDFMSIDEHNEPELEKISVKLKKQLEDKEEAPIYITQGYICRNPEGEVDNLKRGGSDYTASLIGAALEVSEIQIWTDIDGMHNNDPRVVENTYPIPEMSFDEAAELAYFGAKILHPFTVRPAQDKNIPVKLKNTMDPDAHGTVISNKRSGDDIKAVAAKDNITAIRVKSSRMLLAYGFMRQIFEIFEKYRTPIDMITTSEVAVSLTIDDDTHLEDIIRELEVFGNTDVDKDLSIICIAGNFAADKKGLAQKVLSALKDIPLRMVSYGGSRYNISLLVHSSSKEKALIALNDNIFIKQHPEFGDD